jgi:hypothetical protein
MALSLLITFTIIIIIITEIEVGDIEVGAMPFNIFIRLHTCHYLYSLLAAITELFMASDKEQPFVKGGHMVIKQLIIDVQWRGISLN